jgi:hypothetical protein
MTMRMMKRRALEEDKPREPVTFDEVNNLAIQLKTLQVRIGALGGEYHAVTLAMSEAYNDLLSVYKKTKTKKSQRNRLPAIKHQSKHS